MNRFFPCILLTSLLVGIATADESANNFRRINNIQFAEVDGHRLLLDLYMPNDVEQPPLVVWVHGGAWRVADDLDRHRAAHLASSLPVVIVPFGLLATELQQRAPTSCNATAPSDS